MWLTQTKMYQAAPGVCGSLKPAAVNRAFLTVSDVIWKLICNNRTDEERWCPKPSTTSQRGSAHMLPPRPNVGPFLLQIKQTVFENTVVYIFFEAIWWLLVAPLSSMVELFAAHLQSTTYMRDRCVRGKQVGVFYLQKE